MYNVHHIHVLYVCMYSIQCVDKHVMYVHICTIYIHMYGHTHVLYVYTRVQLQHERHTSAHWCAHEIANSSNRKQG